MPYIDNEKRLIFENSINELVSKIENVGDLDYCITVICERLIPKLGGLKFENLAKITGTILFVILENYRRIVVPYEYIKKNENGDVYTKK